MKCEHCGKNEVTFIYQSNINGQVEEKHLCAECADKLGYSKRIQARNRRMMQGFFGDSLFGDSFLNDFFTPDFSLSGHSRMMENLFDDFFSNMPALSAGKTVQEKQPVQEESLLDKQEQSRFSRMRQLNALRMEMKKAARQEDFERAAQLRDQIKALETEPENKESA